MPRARHPKKEIEDALRYAENEGWRVEKRGARAHAWGLLFCPGGTRESCRMSIHSTPRSPSTHAKQIRRKVNACECVPADPGAND